MLRLRSSFYAAIARSWGQLLRPCGNATARQLTPGNPKRKKKGRKLSSTSMCMYTPRSSLIRRAQVDHLAISIQKRTCMLRTTQKRSPPSLRNIRRIDRSCAIMYNSVYMCCIIRVRHAWMMTSAAWNKQANQQASKQTSKHVFCANACQMSITQKGDRKGSLKTKQRKVREPRV